MHSYKKLIQENGSPYFGLYHDPVEEINLSSFKYLNAMDRPKNFISRYFDFKSFHFVGVMSEDIVIGCAIVDLKWLSNGFFYYYLPKTGELKEWSFIHPFSLGCKTSLNPDQGTFSFSHGQNYFEIKSYSNPRKRHLIAKIKNHVDVEIDLTESARHSPLSLCTPTGVSGWTYTQKSSALDVTGKININGNRVEPDKLMGLTDYTAGYLRRETNWRWASMSSILPNGKTLGINLSNGVNETGESECCFWYDHVFHKSHGVHFYFDRLDPMKPWIIHCNDDKIDLTFTPLGVREEKINALLIASNFKQLFGRYSGTLESEDGEKIVIKDQLGFAETHYAKW